MGDSVPALSYNITILWRAAKPLPRDYNQSAVSGNRL